MPNHRSGTKRKVLIDSCHPWSNQLVSLILCFMSLGRCTVQDMTCNAASYFAPACTAAWSNHTGCIIIGTSYSSSVHKYMHMLVTLITMRQLHLERTCNAYRWSLRVIQQPMQSPSSPDIFVVGLDMVRQQPLNDSAYFIPRSAGNNAHYITNALLSVNSRTGSSGPHICRNDAMTSTMYGLHQSSHHQHITPALLLCHVPTSLIRLPWQVSAIRVARVVWYCTSVLCCPVLLF